MSSRCSTIHSRPRWGSSNELNTTGSDTFADDTTIGDGILVNLQVSYAPLRGQTLTAGYRKDFQDAVFTNYVAYNFVFFRYEGTFQNRLGLGGRSATGSMSSTGKWPVPTRTSA